MRNQSGLTNPSITPRPWNVPRGLPEESTPAAQPAPGPTAGVRSRYIQEILKMHSRLSFHRMAGELEKNGALLYHADHGRGLVTVAAHTGQIPERYLLGLAGFRLSEYLHAGFANEDLVFDRSLFCEPIREFHHADMHVITTDSETGRIVGYVTLAHGKDPEPRPLRDPDRLLFPCEDVHNMRLDKVIPDAEGLSTHHIREVKRLAHTHTIADRNLRLRVTLELLAGITMAVHSAQETIRLLIGDVEENVALRHLVLLGLDVCLLVGTTPLLDRGDIMFPRYSSGEKVLPFHAWVPDKDGVAMRGKLLEEAAASASPIRALRGIMNELNGSVEHQRLRGGAAA